MKTMQLARVIVALLAISLAIPAVLADAMLVTVTYDDGDLTISHAERVAGEGTNEDGQPYALVYETATGLYQATTLNIPILILADDGPREAEFTQQTLLVPIQEGATALSLYDSNGRKVVTLSLSQIKKTGDATGTPPAGTIVLPGSNSITQTLTAMQSGAIKQSDMKLTTPTGTQGAQSSGLGWLFGIGIIGLIGLLVIGGGIVVIILIILAVTRKGKK